MTKRKLYLETSVWNYACGQVGPEAQEAMVESTSERQRRCLPMRHESKTMEELHKIREQLYKEAKGLSSEERVSKIEQEVSLVRQKYGLALPRLAGAKRSR